MEVSRSYPLVLPVKVVRRKGLINESEEIGRGGMGVGKVNCCLYAA